MLTTRTICAGHLPSLSKSKVWPLPYLAMLVLRHCAENSRAEACPHRIEGAVGNSQLLLQRVTAGG